LFKRLGGRSGLLDLLNHFYADVRQHKLLGPVFESQVEDWRSHLETIANFWTQVTGGPADYSGQMPARHIPLSLKEEHFQAWLSLWAFNCRCRLPSECAEEMIAYASQIGLRLRHFCDVGRPPGSFFKT